MSTPQYAAILEKDDQSGSAGESRSALVAGAASATGTATAEQLLTRGFRVHCADSRTIEMPSATCHLLPTGAGYLPELARIVRSESIDVLIPVTGTDLAVISTGRMALGSRVNVVATGPGPAIAARDRLLVAWTLTARGIAVPAFGVPSDFACAQPAPGLPSEPLVVRSRWTDKEEPTILVTNASDVAWESLDDGAFVQECLPGTTYTAVVYRPSHGKSRFTTLLEEVSLSDGKSVTINPLVTGPTLEMGRVAQAAVRALGLTGPVEVTLRRRAGASPVVTDVRAGIGPHGHLVPELLDAILREHPPGKAHGSHPGG